MDKRTATLKARIKPSLLSEVSGSADLHNRPLSPHIETLLRLGLERLTEIFGKETFVDFCVQKKIKG